MFPDTGMVEPRPEVRGFRQVKGPQGRRQQPKGERHVGGPESGRGLAHLRTRGETAGCP